MSISLSLVLIGFAIVAVAAFNSKSKKDFSLRNFLKF